MLAEDVILLRQKQRILLQHKKQRVLMSILVPPLPQSHGGHVEAGPGRCSSHCAFVSKLRTFKLGKLYNLFLVCNQTCPTFVLGGVGKILIILDSKPVCPLLQWEIICLFSKVIHFGILWKIVWNKGYQCLYSKGMQKSGWFGTKFSHEVTIKLGL